MKRSAIAVAAVVTLVVTGCTSSDGTASDNSAPAGSTPDTATDSNPASTSAASAEPSEPSEPDIEPEPSEPDTDPEEVDQDTLDWTPCDEQANPLAETECATLTVPVDHDAPDGEQIDIAVARVDSASGDDQIGSLVFNPGGPGGSGIEFLSQASAIVAPEVAQQFDLVSFDPRGVGDSTALECDADFDDEIDLLAAADDAAWQALLDESAQDLDACTPATIELAPDVGTNNAARDLDLLREALGDDGLTYVGYSYGTRLGATYAELFPDNVRALVLDGAVKPTTDFSELDEGQAAGFDRALENVASACDADEDCLLRDIGPTLDVLASVRAEIADVGQFPTDDPDRVLTPGELDLGVLSALYSKDAWPFLAQAIFLTESEQDGSLFQVLTDNYVGRNPDGTYDNSQVANSFINCADDESRPDASEVRAQNDASASESTYFADLLRAGTGCIGLPDAADPLIIGPAEEAPPILVVGSTGDPATPYEWSEEMAESLDSGTLYTVEAEGHTAYGSIDCVAEPVNAYLIDLVVPDEGASCSDNTTADFFVPAGESEIELVVALFDCLRDNGLEVPEITVADVLADPTGETFAELLDPTDPAFVEAIGGCTEILTKLQTT